MMREIEQFYSTQIEEMPMFVQSQILIFSLFFPFCMGANHYL